MPLPDLARPSRVEARLLMHKPVTSGTTGVLTCPANTTIRLRTIYVSNQTSAAQTFTVQIYRGATMYPLNSGVTVNAKNLFNVTTMDDALYLEPGDILIFEQTASTANTLTLFVSYEAIT